MISITVTCEKNGCGHSVTKDVLLGTLIQGFVQKEGFKVVSVFGRDYILCSSCEIDFKDTKSDATSQYNKILGTFFG